MTIRSIALTTATLLLMLSNAEAGMYRWVDDNGVTVYSQTPPASGNATEVKVQTGTPTPAAAPAAAAQPTTTDQKADQTAAAPSGPTKEELAESEKIRKENCEAARHNLDIYQNLGRKMIKTPDGLYKRPNEEERQAMIKEAQEAIKEFCTK